MPKTQGPFSITTVHDLRPGTEVVLAIGLNCIAMVDRRKLESAYTKRGAARIIARARKELRGIVDRHGLSEVA